MATELTLQMSGFAHLKLSSEHMNVLNEGSSDGTTIKVYSLPGNNIAVPSLFPTTHENPLSYLHIRNKKCPLQMCRETKSKLHTLLRKENPICLHTLLSTMAEVDSPTEISTLTNAKKKTTKLDRIATIEVRKAVTKYVPYMTSLA